MVDVTGDGVLDPRRGSVRAARAVVLTVPAVGVAAWAHRSVDSCLDVPGLLLAAGACWSGAVAVLGAQRRLPALLTWLIVTQVITHVLLQLTCTAPGSLLPGTRGLAAHALAVLVTGLLLHRADDDLWVAHALVRAVRRWLLLAVPVLLPPMCRAVVPADGTGWALHPRLIASPVGRRGPPSSALR